MTTRVNTNSSAASANEAALAGKANLSGAVFSGTIRVAGAPQLSQIDLAVDDRAYIGGSLCIGGLSDANVASGNGSIAAGFRNTVPGSSSFAMGVGNTIQGLRNFAFGQSILITSLQAYNFAVGFQHNLTGINQSNLIFGDRNSVHSVKFNLLAGSENRLTNSSAGSTSVQHNLVSGRLNYVDSGGRNLVAGQSNSAVLCYDSVVAGLQNSASTLKNSFVAGASNIIKSCCNTLVAGKSNTVTAANQSVVLGELNNVTADWSTVGGYNNLVSANNSIVMGQENNVSGGFHSVVGYNNVATAQFSFIAGTSNASNNDSNIVAGTENVANGKHCLAVGLGVTVGSSNDWFSTAVGYKSVATGTASFAGGTQHPNTTKASALGKAAFTYGEGTRVFGNANHSQAFGSLTEVGKATPDNNQDTANQATAFGYNTKAQDDNTIAAGNGCIAEGHTSFAFGQDCRTHPNAQLSFVHGFECQTGESPNTGSFEAKHSTAIGYKCRAYKNNSFAGGNETFSFGDTSFAFGNGAVASAGFSNIALGQGITTATDSSSADGDGQVAVGRFNEYAYTGTVPQMFAVGTGTADGSRYTSMYVGPRTTANANIVMRALKDSTSYTSDTNAGNGGVPLGGLYRNGNTVRIRLTN